MSENLHNGFLVTACTCIATDRNWYFIVRCGNLNLQHWELKTTNIRNSFLKMKSEHPERMEARLNLSWSNWGFGLEPMWKSVARLEKTGVRFIELHGNHYGPDLGYRLYDTKTILDDYGIRVSGICGMFSRENDMSSPFPHHRQAAIDYVKREVEFAQPLQAEYMLIVPGAVGRPDRYDGSEYHRSIDTMRRVADVFVEGRIKAAIEPIRSAEVSLVHTVKEAKKYIADVNHPGVRHINGDVFHMQAEEQHIGDAILDAGDMLINLHMADTNRRALGLGSMDIDTIIMSLYLIGFNSDGRFVTPEPLGPGADPYPAMHSVWEPAQLDEMVKTTIGYFREREDIIRSM